MEPDRVSPEVAELLPDYLADARECLERASGILLAIERGDDDPELRADLYRQMHVIKGGAGLMGFRTVEAVTHAAETALGPVKRGERPFTPALAAGLLRAHDVIAALLNELEADGRTRTDPGPALEALEAAARGEEPAPSETEPAPSPEAPPDPPADGLASDDEVVQEFFVEAWELMEELEQDLVALEESPDDAELLNKIFRAAHTLKGSSSFLGFDAISRVTHRVEDVFNKLRRGEMVASGEVMDVVLEAVDRLRRLLEAAQAGRPGPAVDDVLGALTEAVESGRPKRLGEILVEQEGVPAEAVEKALQSQKDGKPLGQVLVEQKAVPPEVVERGLARQRQMQRPAPEQTVRVDVGRLDTLMNLVGELVLAKNRLARLRAEAEERWPGEDLVEALGETSAQVDLVASDLQLAVMKTRLVPIGKVFRKFPRMVRDLARNLGKGLRLEVEGEGTELDKSVVEVIGDPLVHLIRNAADHGVEPPEERERARKPRDGVIRLSARHEGNHIVVEVADDGRGMDPERLKAKAVEKGLLSAQDAAALSPKEAFNLVFAPGFSTAEKVSNVSGRGVGMDVVRTNIQQLNGLIEIDSEPGRGTKVELRIPLTLAIIQALLVRCGPEVYAIPLVSVLETVRVEPGQVKPLDGVPVLRLRDQVVPLVYLDRLLAVPPHERSAREYVVVIGLAEKRVGVVVGGLLGEQEVVIKSLGGYLSDTPAVAGATILGDGRVTLILDVNQVLDLAGKTAPPRAAA
ncbi:chemotaxis protein CheA [Deferrisoma camini]|uniref:chemotaxis protein CheA n=1 Tax=Deferrisoma camini TaxID=1035120 RepID=UPI00046C8EBB|nr:chemotaxis protein CheA [Deferrisoma camini]